MTGIIVTNGKDLLAPGVAAIASVVAVVLLVNAVQFGAWARHYNASPDDVRNWHADHATEGDYYAALLARHDALYNRYARLARICYGGGIVLLLLALTVVVAPPEEASQFWPRAVAAMLAAFGAVIESLWVGITLLSDTRSGQLPPRLERLQARYLPRLKDVPPPVTAGRSGQPPTGPAKDPGGDQG